MTGSNARQRVRPHLYKIIINILLVLMFITVITPEIKTKSDNDICKDGIISTLCIHEQGK